MAAWGFYGRKVELIQIERLLQKKDFFFCSISGRRRIGKTSLIQEVLKRRRESSRALYVQIPDSDERGVVQVFEDSVEDAMRDQNFARETCTDFFSIALLLNILWKNGYVTAIDEFQYFHRKTLSPFLSNLQSEIDSIRRDDEISGGFFALGSIHTEMTAVLEDKTSPLFNRVTDRIEVSHWDAATLFEMFRDHDVSNHHQRLFLWSIFEGVPKFYRDCFDHDVLKNFNGDYRRNTLRRMFFEGSSPLKDEADNWFLRELRGRYDSVLKIVARTSPCSYGTLRAEYERTGPKDEKQLGGYLKTLIEKYKMIDKVSPILAKEKGRKARYEITDNFLSAWLSSIARNIQLARIRPIDDAVSKADISLQVHEGFMFEKFIKSATQECSRKGVGDFNLTDFVKGYWNKPDGTDIEIDVVAFDEDSRIIRLGSCKRSSSKHDPVSLAKFNQHINRFRSAEMNSKYKGWKVERVLYSPSFTSDERRQHEGNKYRCIDMKDFEEWLS